MSTTTSITGFKTKCLLNKEQVALFDKTVNASRFTYNKCLELVKAEEAKTGKITTKHIKITDLRNQFPWLKEVSANSLNGTLNSLKDGIDRFFTKQNEFPTFKNRYSKKSIKHRCDCYLYMKGNSMYAVIPKFGHVKLLTDFSDSRNQWDYESVTGITLSQDSVGDYFVSFHAISTTNHYQKTNKAIGIDPGLTSFATLSTGKKIKNPRFRERTEDRIKTLQRKLKKCTKNSIRYKKYKEQIAVLHRKSANQLNDFHKKTSNKVCKNYDFVGIEDTQTKNMMARGKKKTPRRLGKSFAQVGIGSFITHLKNKAERVGKTVVLVPARNTTKTCNCCGHVHKHLTLKDRSWSCPVCGVDHDRDINAAKNILRLAQQRFTGGGIVAGNNTGLPNKRTQRSGLTPVSKNTCVTTSCTSSLPLI